MSMKIESYHEVSIAIEALDVDAVSNYIIDNISTGLLLEDEEGNSHTTIKFYVSTDIAINDKLAALKVYLSEVNPAYNDLPVGTKRIDNIDWLESYRKSVVPIEIGDAIVIKPPWYEDPFPGKQVIVIEPKMAFGTGKHETTRSCLAELEKMATVGKTVFDLGCGSGILGIYAALNGAAKVVGYDTDPLSVENSIENFEINNVADVCEAHLGSIDDIADKTTYDIVIANIIKKVIVPIIGKLRAKVSPCGHLILSGLLNTDAPEVEAALTQVGLTDFSIRPDNEWITYTIHV